MSDDRFVFEPVYDLRTARACGVEIVPRRASETIARRAREAGWGPRQVADVDAGTVLSALAHARRSDAGVPVQVDLAADTVVLARDRLRGMLDGRGVAPMLEIGPAVAAAPADALVAGLTELRAWGFRLALDGIGRGFGPALIDAVRPDVVKLEPGPVGPAVVGAVCRVAASVGTRVAATGVTDRGQLAALHAAGVELAQGPLLGVARETPAPDPAGAPALLGLADQTCAPRAPSRPAMAMVGSRAPSGTVPPVPPSPPSGTTAVPGPIRTLGSAAVTVPDDAVADAVRTTIGEHPEAGGVVLVDARHRPTGYLDRSRFLLAMAGPFGHALWANKPARDMADPPRVADERTSVRDAMEIGMSGDPARGYDDLVLVGPDGTCTGVVPVSELWRSALRRDHPAPARVLPSPVPRERPVRTA